MGGDHFAQTISGAFPSMAGEWVRFGTFRGLQSVQLDSVKVGKEGTFSIPFKAEEPAVGYLMGEEGRPFFLILDEGSDIRLKGERIGLPESIRVERGQQNIAFGTYASQHPRREQALSAWMYLERMYSADSLFSLHKAPSNAIREEQARIKAEDEAFLASLDPKWYVTWYLPTRRLVSEVSVVAQYRPEEIPATVAALRRLDYANERLYRSGLLKDAIEGHFWLLENCGKPLDSVYVEMERSIDAMLPGLMKDERRLNEVTDYLFDLLERHSLFRTSEYLALKLLNQASCTLDGDLAKQLETYRKMKVGNLAPDFVFPPTWLAAELLSRPGKLSDIRSAYKVVVFGAGWCGKCKEDLPAIARLYPKWKGQGVEVVFVSLDENEQAFRDFAGSLPFLSTCDFRKWEGEVVQAYHVFSTPTMFLLDKDLKIVLRPNSVNQMDAWVDWFLVKGNK